MVPMMKVVGASHGAGEIIVVLTTMKMVEEIRQVGREVADGMNQQIQNESLVEAGTILMIQIVKMVIVTQGIGNLIRRRFNLEDEIIVPIEDPTLHRHSTDQDFRVLIPINNEEHMKEMIPLADQ